MASESEGAGPASGLQILIVDDEELQQRAISMAIDEEHVVYTASSSAEALELIDREVVDLALVDVRLGAESGLDLISRLIGAAPWLRVVMLTAHATVESAVEAMRAGASDYLVKPVDAQAIRILVERFAASRRLERQVQALEEDLQHASPPPLLESRNPAMQRVFALAETVATSEAVVLIRGESGTGKGVLARRIHETSARSDSVFAVINCPSLSPELLQSELFGHVKGAFTGAVKTQMGKVEVASGGTLFLDEVGDLPPRIQPKLLRFIQDREYERVGDPRTRRADVRIVSATNRDLEDAIEEGDFREDLFYRLNVMQLHVPPLRERPEDVEDLARAFLAFFAARHNRTVDDFTPRRVGCAARLPVARQRAGAPERRRTRGHPLHDPARAARAAPGTPGRLRSGRVPRRGSFRRDPGPDRSLLVASVAAALVANVIAALGRDGHRPFPRGDGAGAYRASDRGFRVAG